MFSNWLFYLLVPRVSMNHFVQFFFHKIFDKMIFLFYFKVLNCSYVLNQPPWRQSFDFLGVKFHFLLLYLLFFSSKFGFQIICLSRSVAVPICYINMDDGNCCCEAVQCKAQIYLFKL